MPDQRPVAIANTSPLQYLHQCGLSDLFARLYREVLVPPAVVQELPAPERAALAHDLIASLDAEDQDPRADTLWAAEIERRAREASDGKVTLIDSDEVHAEIAQRLRARTGR